MALIPETTKVTRVPGSASPRRLEDAKEWMTVHVLEREIHEVRPRVDRDSVRVSRADFGYGPQRAITEPICREHTRLGSDIEPTPRGIPRQDIGPVGDLERLNNVHRAKIDDEQRGVALTRNEGQTTFLIELEAVRMIRSREV